MVDHELLNSPENIYFESYDFPVTEAWGSQYTIDWNAPEVTDLTKRIEKNISITSENTNNFIKEFEELRYRHGYPYARLDWIHKPDSIDDWHSLECIMPDAGGGVWMYIFSGAGDHAGTPMELNLTSEKRLDLHNIDHADTAIFLIESLAHYLRYAGIAFPYISTDIKSIHKDNRFGSNRDIIDLSYSFELPYEPLFDYEKKISFFTENQRIKMLEITNERIAIDEMNFATLEQGANGQKVWKVDRIESGYAAIRLFSLLSKPLKWRYII